MRLPCLLLPISSGCPPSPAAARGRATGGVYWDAEDRGVRSADPAAAALGVAGEG